MNVSRRQLLRAMALGGGLIAGELWVPGAKTFFLPSNKLEIDVEKIRRAIARLQLQDAYMKINPPIFISRPSVQVFQRDLSVYVSATYYVQQRLPA